MEIPLHLSVLDPSSARPMTEGVIVAWIISIGWQRRRQVKRRRGKPVLFLNCSIQIGLETTSAETAYPVVVVIVAGWSFRMAQSGGPDVVMGDRPISSFTIRTIGKRRRYNTVGKQ